MKIYKLLCVNAAIAISTTIAGFGCKTTPQQVAYQAAGSTSVAVDAAIAGYDVFAKAGKTTVEQNQKVAEAFVKYQSAFAVVADAGSVYAATGTTNAPALAAYNQAVSESSQSITDLLTLINSFNLK